MLLNGWHAAQQWRENQPKHRGTTPPSTKLAGRGKLPPRKRQSSGSGGQNSSKAAKRGFARPKVGSVPEQDNASKLLLSETRDTAKNILSGATEVVVTTLVNTGPANALLAPLHNWSSSRKRVAEAVESAAAEAAAGETRPATAAEREGRDQQRSRSGEQEEIRINPWLELLRDTVPVPQPVKSTYNALVSVAAVPGQLVQTGKQTAEALALAAETAGAMPDRVRETVARSQATVRTAQEVLAGTPDRVQGVVTATREFPVRVERAVEEGTEAVEAAVEAGRKAAEAVETLPSRLPALMETVGDDALFLAEGTASGVDAAGTALWGLTKEVALWAADLVLRQALAPVHKYRTSARRVQAALDEEQAALPQTSSPPRPSAEKAPSSPALSVTAGTIPPVAGDTDALREDTSPDIGDSIPVSRLTGLRGRLSSWRRKRKSIPADAVASEDDDEDDGIENVVSGRETNPASSSSSKPATSQEPRAKTASPDARGKARVAARWSDTGAEPLGEEAGLEATAKTKTPTVENLLVDDGQVAAGELLVPVPGPVAGGGAEASSKEKVSLAPVGALAVSVASEDRGAGTGAPAPAPARTLRATVYEEESEETSSESEGPIARVTAEDPFNGRRSSEMGERAQADAEPARGTSVGGEAIDYTGREQNGPRSSSPVAAISPSNAGAGAVAAPHVDTDSNDKDAMLDGPDPRSTAGKQVAAEKAPSASGDQPGSVAVYSASRSSPVPTGTALSPRSPSQKEASRKKEGRGNLAAREGVETPAKTEEREGPSDKPPVLTSKVAKDEIAAATGEAVPRVAGKAGGAGGGRGTLEAPSGTWNATNPAAEFLKDWVDKAVPQKKAELKRMESVVCWERQWYPVAIVSEVLQQQQQRRFRMLDREYELARVPSGGQRTSHENRRWDLERTRSSVEPAAAAARVPLRESSGLLWAWPDTSPEGLAAADLASPVSLPGFFGVSGELGSAPGAWRRLLRRQTASPRATGSNDENGGGGQQADWENRENQRYVLAVEREISCGFSDAVRGLLAASHGQAMRALAAGGDDDGNAPEDDDLLVASSVAGGNESSGVLRADFDTSSVQGEVLLSFPNVVEWRFAPAPKPAVDGTPASVAQEESATATATKHAPAVAAVSSRRRNWLRRRLSGLGGGGRGTGGRTKSTVGSDPRDRGAVGNDMQQGRTAHYVASLLPVGPNRTKVFARLEVEPSGLLGGRSLWWSRRNRRALLVAALDKVATGRSAATAGGKNQLLSSAAEAWLEGVAEGGPF